MSADNWTICPKCKKAHSAKQIAKSEKVTKSYGKVSAEEYMKLLREAETVEPLEQSMREDYEQGMDDEGNYYVAYSCSCHTCGFGWEYKHEEKVEIK